MNNEILMDAIGKIDDEFIKEAEIAYPKKIFKVSRIVTVAACLVLIVSSAVYVTRNYNVFDKNTPDAASVPPAQNADNNDIVTSADIEPDNAPSASVEVPLPENDNGTTPAKKNSKSSEKVLPKSSSESVKSAEKELPESKREAIVAPNDAPVDTPANNPAPAMGGDVSSGDGSSPDTVFEASPEPNVRSAVSSQSIAESVSSSYTDDFSEDKSEYTPRRSLSLSYAEYSDDEYTCSGSGYTLSVYRLKNTETALEFSEKLAEAADGAERYDIILIEHDSSDSFLLSVCGDSEPVGTITDETLTNYNASILQSK